MADYDWFDNGKTQAEVVSDTMLQKGFKAVFSNFRHTDILYFECLRGCGCIVWNIEVHRNNVCKDEHWNL